VMDNLNTHNTASLYEAFEPHEAWRLAKEGRHREHVTVFMYEHPDLFRFYSFKQDNDLSGLRWTVDEAEDLEFVRRVYGYLYRKEGVFLTEDILKLIEREPHVADINKGIKQKPVVQSYNRF